MREWIITGALYVLGMGLFAILGGIGAAGDALRNWGRISASRRGRSSDVSR
jgi:hypothetical protein